MARAKKEAALTPEERLQAALVPDWEWPYKLPENWCWTYQKAVCSLSTGEKRIGNDYPYWEVKCLRGITLPQIVSSGNFVPVFSKVILVDGENSGEVFTILTSGYMGSTFRMLQISAVVFPKYLELFILSNKDVYRNRKTGSAIPHLNKKLFFSTPFPLPPLAEQQRIVDRIESLFAKLDEAKEKAQAVVDSFETRKAAILHKAFTGELTAKWREEHGVGMESWEVRTLDSVCSSIFDGDHMPPPKAESGIPFLVISNVNTGHLTFENTRFVPQEYYDTLSDTRKPQLGDVLYTLVGSFGIPVVVNSKRPFCFQRHMALLRPIDVSPQFLWYILQTPEMYDKASSIATGTAQLTVPIKGLRAMTIPRPKIAEQVEIVRILDGFFAREQSAKEAAEIVLDQIELMKKSIFARAFRGELGTNDPSEESAVELLKEIIRRG